MKQLSRLERLAVAAHQAGTTWPDFWRQHGHDVAAVHPDDYFARGRLVHRLIGLVASGDTDGQRPVDAGYGRPFDFELEALEAAR
jgi:hypothetical protein